MRCVHGPSPASHTTHNNEALGGRKRQWDMDQLIEVNTIFASFYFRNTHTFCSLLFSFNSSLPCFYATTSARRHNNETHIYSVLGGRRRRRENQIELRRQRWQWVFTLLLSHALSLVTLCQLTLVAYTADTLTRMWMMVLKIILPLFCLLRCLSIGARCVWMNRTHLFAH